ncbi:hypothetical protein [Streptomyces liangshanensis]|uniref:Uncharacterized protein n=1 Tax=Streptomyces liangshanensis TaxID=2717324 RepID=A0A6G9H7D1_9ACTN|nr:hypothetical protein [Streptomyces liangshanensis]QIQ06216.1 hypothetical protein HA039_31375 [Streptomyces liangshanensis]
MVPRDPIQPAHPSERDSVARHLRAHYPELWPPVPVYGAYDRSRMLRCAESIDSVLHKVGCFPDHAEAFERTVGYAERAFDLYEGRREPSYPADRVFLAPSRMADDDPLYGDEFGETLPLLTSLHGLDSGTVRHFLSLLPPSVLCSYQVHDGRQGHIVLAPLNSGLTADLGADRAAETARRVVQDAAVFARDRLGARVAGLGATLPSLTRFGRTVDVPGLVTTTGHGGTVHLIRILARDVAATLLDGSGPLTVGVLGAAGSIGASILAALQQEFPDTPFVACDRPGRLGRVRRVAERQGNPARTLVTADPADLFSRCRLIVSAITEKLDLSRAAAGADLTGTVLIDDSQPGCVARDQWEARGGLLLWPVGSAEAGGPLHRENDLLFGAASGVVHPYDVWGCEAEAAAVALTGEHDAALRAPVTPDDALRVGELCARIGVTAAQPQSYGRPAVPAPVADRKNCGDHGGRAG